MASSVYLIRHTLVAVGPTVCYGATDVSLAPGYENAFEQTKNKLPAEIFQPSTVLVSSPLSRCFELATYLHSAGLSNPVADDRLREMDFGQWETVPWADIPEDARATWLSDVERNAPPGGESFGAVFQRARECMDTLVAELQDAPGDTAVVITHGGVIRTLFAHLIGCTLDQALRLNVDYGGVSHWSTAGRGRFEYVNR